MKKSISVIFVILFAFFLFNMKNAFSQEYGQAEFLIVNNIGNNEGFPITIDVYPVGAIFNGANPGEYTPIAVNKIDPQNNFKICGWQQFPLPNQTNQQYFAKINFDKSDQFSQCNFSLGYGKYRLDIYYGGPQPFSCYVDFSDANFTGTTTTNPPYIQQFKIEYLSNGTVQAKFNDPNASYVTIENGDTFAVWEQSGTSNPPLTPSKGNFTDSQDPNSLLHQFPLDAKNFGFFEHISPEKVYLNLKVTNSNASLNAENSNFTFSNCVFNLDHDKTFTINRGTNQNPTMNISGSESQFVTGSGSIIYLPENFIINISDNSGIDCNNTTFTSNSTPYWNGINLSSSRHTYIKDCTFEYATNPIYSESNGNHIFSIIHNTFRYIKNDPNIYNTCITTINTYNIFISDNDFILGPECSVQTTAGVYILRNASSEDENNDAPWDSRYVIIENNFFQSGAIQLWIEGIADDFFSYITGNEFTGGTGGFQPGNIVLWNSDCKIYRNYIHQNCYTNFCFFIYNSNPDFLENTISGPFVNIMTDGSEPCLNPTITSENQYIWKGGKNILESTITEELGPMIWLYNGNNLFTNYGKNRFKIEPSSYCHIAGNTNISGNEDYHTNCNFWYRGTNQVSPCINLYAAGGGRLLNIDWESGGNCDYGDQIVGRIVKDLGNGFIDTTIVTQSNNNQSPGIDESLYASGIESQDLKAYSTAISNFKNLINNYPYSKYLKRGTIKLFECYEQSDTNHNQNWRNLIFVDFKNYISDKIQQYENNEEFVKLAFDLLLKSNIKLKNYNSAMDGYEFIANNSSYPLERFDASLSYLAVEGLIVGQGGSEKENLSNKYENIKPIKEILLNAYSRTTKSVKQKEERELKNTKDINKTKRSLIEKHNSDKVLQVRALDNIKISGTLNKKQRQEKIRKELEFLRQRKINDFPIEEHTLNPVDYSLFQNYPNPFNPITNIKYSIKEQKLVTLKIYDILGREVKTLVNEVKTPGEYLVEFNGSELSSGIYFYRIVVGDFTAVKRMVLIK